MICRHTLPTHSPCDACGTLTPIERLDAKPDGWFWSLAHAARTGRSFDRLECQRCYGPDFVALDGTARPVRGWRRPIVAARAALRRGWFLLVDTVA